MRRLLLTACLAACFSLTATFGRAAGDSATTGTTPAIAQGQPAGTYALMQTNHGEFLIHLFPEKSPLAVASFVGLAEGTKSYTDPRTGKPGTGPYFDGTVFHRVVAGFMIQGGDPTATGSGGPGYEFANENSSDLQFGEPGLFAMANAGPNTNGSQFFVTVDFTKEKREQYINALNGGYTIFGKVVKGQSVAEEISQVPVEPQPGGGENSHPIKPITLDHVKIIRISDKPAPAVSTSTTSSTKSSEIHTTKTTKKKPKPRKSDDE